MKRYLFSLISFPHFICQSCGCTAHRIACSSVLLLQFHICANGLWRERIVTMFTHKQHGSQLNCIHLYCRIHLVLERFRISFRLRVFLNIKTVWPGLAMRCCANYFRALLHNPGVLYVYLKEFSEYKAYLPPSATYIHQRNSENLIYDVLG